MRSNYVITGGCGFIGRRVASRLLRDGHVVRLLDNLSTGTRPPEAVENGSWNKDLSLHVGDIRDLMDAASALEGAHVVIHLAANTGVGPSVADPFADMEANVLGTLTILEAARTMAVPRVVFASSGAPLGVQVPPLHENMAPRPASPYGASKLAGEGYCSAYHHAFGLETVALRFGNVYGPDSTHKSSVVAKFIKAALSGESWEIRGDGSQTRDFIHVDDIAAALIAAATAEGVAGEVFQIATAAETSVNEIAAILAKLLAERGLPRPQITAAALPPGDVARNFSDTSKARQRLGWKAEISLETGLRETLDWFIAAVATERKVA